ncbi:MAG: class I SAM-dependent methyltransferase [Bacillota bacterium]|nr:class I SAM-dependent methyltransferase [Bacillota bacterium]
MKAEIIDSLKKSYNKYADVREKSEIQPWKADIRENFLNLLKREEKTTLLDLGAGPGRDSKFFNDNGLKIMAADFSREMVRLCKEKGLEARELDFLNLHLLNRKFDAVWALNSLLHIDKKDLPRVLNEIKGVLNPDGIFFLGVYGGEDFEGIWEQDRYTPHRFFSFYTDEEIKDKVKKYFSIIDFKTMETGGRYHFQSLVLKNV